MSVNTLQELSQKLTDMAGQLIDHIEHEADPAIAHLYLIQSRTCLSIAKDKKKLQNLYRAINDGEYGLFNLDPGSTDVSEED